MDREHVPPSSTQALRPQTRRVLLFRAAQFKKIWRRGRPAKQQVASGSIDVAEDYVRLEVFLPWLLAKLAETLQPLIRKEGTLLIEKK